MNLKLFAGAAVAAIAGAHSALADPTSSWTMPGWEAPPPVSGPYIAGDIGYHQPWNINVDPRSVNVRLNGDAVGFGRIGYRIDPHWRVELEGGYRPDHATNRGSLGHVNNGSLMVNGLFDVLPNSK